MAARRSVQVRSSWASGCRIVPCRLCARRAISSVPHSLGACSRSSSMVPLVSVISSSAHSRNARGQVRGALPGLAPCVVRGIGDVEVLQREQPVHLGLAAVVHHPADEHQPDDAGERRAVAELVGLGEHLADRAEPLEHPQPVVELVGRVARGRRCRICSWRQPLLARLGERREQRLGDVDQGRVVDDRAAVAGQRREHAPVDASTASPMSAASRLAAAFSESVDTEDYGKAPAPSRWNRGGRPPPRVRRAGASARGCQAGCGMDLCSR